MSKACKAPEIANSAKVSGAYLVCAEWKGLGAHTQWVLSGKVNLGGNVGARKIGCNSPKGRILGKQRNIWMEPR